MCLHVTLVAGVPGRDCLLLSPACRQLFGSRRRWGVCAVASLRASLPGYHDATASSLPVMPSTGLMAPGIEACAVCVSGRPE